MRIMALADLHLTPGNLGALKQAAEEIKNDDIDVVVIAGDVSDWGISFLFETLHEFIEKPIVFCLGNHEFAHRNVNVVLKKCRQQQGLYMDHGIHCLDVEGLVEIDGVTFGGNVLWYDGSLGKMNDDVRKNMMEHISLEWLDSTIADFRPADENALCVERIMHLKDAAGPKVLVTHTVPHAALNWFETNEPDSPFNIYSGMADLLSKVNPDVAICGHTHKPVKTRIGDCRCFNIGNDYWRRSHDLKKEIIEI